MKRFKLPTMQEKAERIVSLREQCCRKLTAAKEEHWRECRRKQISALLESKWLIGKEICTGYTDYFELAQLIGVREQLLRPCAAFYTRYPNGDYDLRPWTKHIIELPKTTKLRRKRTRLRIYGDILQVVAKGRGEHENEAYRSFSRFKLHATCSISSRSERGRLHRGNEGERQDNLLTYRQRNIPQPIQRYLSIRRSLWIGYPSGIVGGLGPLVPC